MPGFGIINGLGEDLFKLVDHQQHLTPFRQDSTNRPQQAALVFLQLT
jgi:hypothetical protein